MTSSTITKPTSRSPQGLARARRWAAFKDAWREFCKSKSGVFGLVILIVVVLLAILAPYISDQTMLDPTLANAPTNHPPSWEYPLGTDPLGRRVDLELLWGARVSLLVGIAATLMSMVIGTIVGLLAGHYRGWGSAILMRIIDFFLVVPGLVLAIVLASVLQRGVWTIIIAIGVTSWAGTARLIRAQTLTVETRGFIERSIALGAGHGHILGRHVLPGVMPLVMTSTTLTVGSAIISEATLSFLGVNDSTVVSWGAMLQLALGTGAAIGGYWWFVLAPGVAIVIVVLAFTLVGRAIETVINPTLRGR
jgi:peptide/nickel transport system permease protein